MSRPAPASTPFRVRFDPPDVLAPILALCEALQPGMPWKGLLSTAVRGVAVRPGAAVPAADVQGFLGRCSDVAAEAAALSPQALLLDAHALLIAVGRLRDGVQAGVPPAVLDEFCEEVESAVQDARAAFSKVPFLAAWAEAALGEDHPKGALSSVLDALDLSGPDAREAQARLRAQWRGYSAHERIEMSAALSRPLPRQAPDRPDGSRGPVEEPR